jgi:hypothetical protein
MLKKMDHVFVPKLLLLNKDDVFVEIKSIYKKINVMHVHFGVLNALAQVFHVLLIRSDFI